MICKGILFIIAMSASYEPYLQGDIHAFVIQKSKKSDTESVL